VGLVYWPLAKKLVDGKFLIYKKEALRTIGGGGGSVAYEGGIGVDGDLQHSV